MKVHLVVTHEDDPAEVRWFASVSELARRNGIPVMTPRQPTCPSLLARVRELAPDWIFSFYYRHLLPPPLLAAARRGAYNLHGSLLPRFRGRSPVNWAIIHGERETGASLHVMTARADAGDVIDRQAVPILLNDTALDVARKVAFAAETLLLRTVPALHDGTAVAVPQNPAEASYFGGRTAEDGRIDWSQSARRIHDLVRAVAPPFPGAFTDTSAGPLILTGSHYRGLPALGAGPRLYYTGDVCWADCCDGLRLRVLGLALNGASVNAATFTDLFGEALAAS